jgi:restriction system protein
MKRFWVIAPAPVEEINTFEKAWEYDLSHNVIAIGWGQMGDISSFDENQLKEKIDKTYTDLNQGQKTLYFNSIWNFWHNIQLGDIIIARKGRKRIAAVGKVTGTAFYDEKMGKDRMPDRNGNFYKFFISVDWINDKKDIVFDKQVFSMLTIYEITESKYELLLKGKLPDEPEEPESEIINKSEFYMEKYLEDFIVSNFKTIFPENLELYQDEEGNDSSQYLTDVGRIDILAKDKKTNTYIVIELKKGKESDKVVGQILRYMGWVKENLAVNNEEVKGLIICKEIDQKLKYAVSVIKDISVKCYHIDFRLSG